jgi:hypothetical protein
MRNTGYRGGFDGSVQVNRDGGKTWKLPRS